jgi:hypothetical protein
MVGCFGLLDGWHPSHFPASYLVESRGRLDAHKLNRCGALTEGMVTELRCGDRAYQLARHTPDVLVNGHRVPVVWDEHARPWFLCPACGRRCKHVYLDELACRICCRLDYACRHLHRQIPGLHRIRRLRRMIGADQRPFAPLPKRPRHHVRFHRVAAEIRALERALVGHLGGINRDLERRARLRGMIPK